MAITIHFRYFNDNCDDSLVAARVILSAGSTGSTELLLRCKHQYRTLDQISPALGHKFSSNGEYIYAGTLLPRGMPVYPTRGPSITACAKFIEGDEPFLVEDCGITDQMRAMFRKQLFRRKNALQLFERYIQGDLRIELPLKNEIRRTWGRINRLLPYLIMGHDSGNGRIFLNSRGKLCIDWPRDQNYAYYQKARNIVRRISCATGGKFVEDLWALNDKSFTAHPLGGCVMGDSINSSVVNASGQVHGYPNLHVIDGAVIPGPVGVNPSLTITAVAELINSRIK